MIPHRSELRQMVFDEASDIHHERRKVAEEISHNAKGKMQGRVWLPMNTVRRPSFTSVSKLLLHFKASKSPTSSFRCNVYRGRISPCFCASTNEGSRRTASTISSPSYNWMVDQFMPYTSSRATATRSESKAPSRSMMIAFRVEALDLEIWCVPRQGMFAHRTL